MILEKLKKNIQFFVFIFSITLWSQNQHEPQHWEKLKSTYVDIIYKIGQEKEAQQIANTISYIQRNNQNSIGFHYQPVTIILRANTVESNGFVTYSPFRSEFFNTPPQEFNTLGTTNWISTLAIHEYRHVQQFLNHKEGVTNVLSYLFGNSGWAVGSIVSVPDWYFEGDAVVMETALSKSGRGRLPSFTALQRALYQENEIYDYAKIRNGSYKNLIPSQYQTGYQILNYYRNHYNAYELGDIARKAASFQFPFYGFSYQLKKETGLGTTKMYQKSATENQNIWKKQRDSLQTKTYAQLTKKQKKVALYKYPQLMENGNIIALKSSFDKISAFYQLDSLGNETKIAPAAYQVDSYFNYKNQQLVYTGFSLNIRYNNSSYNDVYIYNFKTKKRKRISYQKRYFSPSFNADNTSILVTEQDQNKSAIVVLDAQNAKIQQKIPIDGFVSRPQFINNNQFAFIKKKNNQIAIFRIDKNKNQTQLTPWTSHPIDNITIANNSVYYSASFNGIDNIYTTPLDGSSKIQQITNAHIGAYQPFINNKTVYFTEQTSNGTKISYTAIHPTLYQIKEPVLMNWNNQKTVAFEKGNILDKLDNKTYPTSKYKSIFSDLIFHDWEYSVTNQKLNIEVTATNYLNDFSLKSYSNIYLNENNSFNLGAVASFKKWFPVFNLQTEIGNRDFNHSLPDNTGIYYDGALKYNSITLMPSVTIPLAQTKGNFATQFSLNIGYEYSKRFSTMFTLKNNGQEVKLDSQTFTSYNTSLGFASVKRKATQQISSRLGFSTVNNFKKGLTGTNAIYFSTSNRLFLPGILNDHNSYLSFNYQRNDDLLQTDSFTYARGYQISPSEKASYFSYTYQLPLFYPDFGVLGITYFKRVRANLFADFSKVEFQNNTKKQQNSIGFELIFDNTFLNLSQLEIGIGYRGSFLLNNPSISGNRYVSGLFINTPLF